MGFTATPVDGSGTPIPMSSAVPDGTNTPLAIEGGPSISTGGNTLVPVSMYVKDGNDVAQGLTTDTAVVGDNTGTISAKLRGLTKIFNDVWDSVNHRLHVNVDNVNANGQATMVNSAPVVLASDQLHAANIDGNLPGQLPAVGNYLYSSGGPIDSTGKPQQAAWDRLASWQGKVSAGASTNITATVSGDNNIVFSVAPKTIMPGQKVTLSVGTGNPVETVIVSSSYTPSSSATTIPLQYPVVTAASTTAKWDVYGVNGPGVGAMLANDMPITMLAAYNANGPNPITLVTGGLDAQGTPQMLEVSPGLLNAAGTADRMRGNLDVILLASAARTTTQTSADIVNYNGRGIKVILDMTTVGTGSVTLTINFKDPASGKYILLLSGVAVITNITSVYTIYPGAPVTANVSVNDLLPRTFQIVATANNANSATYSVGYSLIL